MAMESKPVSKDTRRFHRKSRNGCIQCKQRHVKCDEIKPCCGNCAQTNRPCSFLRLMPSMPISSSTVTSSSPGRASGPPTPASAASSCTTAATVAPPLYSAIPYTADMRLFSSYSQSPEFSLADLSMLQNFITSTSRTLSPSPEVQHLWGTTMVQMGLQHRFLLHGLLALSAMHLTYTGNQNDTISYRQLVDYAARHQTISLSLYQHALVNPSSGQHDALFALSVVIFFLAIAALRDENSATTEAGGIGAIVDCKWIRLARGIVVVNQDQIEALSSGPLAILFVKDIPLHPEKPKEETLSPELQILPRLWRSENVYSPSPSPGTSTGPLPFYRYDTPMISKEDRQAYEEAFTALASTHSRVMEYMRNRHSDTADLARTDQFISWLSANPRQYDRIRTEMFMWVLRVPERYIELLDRQDSVALIILTHYAALLCKDRHSWWCLPSARAIISRVSNFLDDKLKKWIESPMADVRLTDG